MQAKVKPTWTDSMWYLLVPCLVNTRSQWEQGYAWAVGSETACSLSNQDDTSVVPRNGWPLSGQGDTWCIVPEPGRPLLGHVDPWGISEPVCLLLGHVDTWPAESGQACTLLSHGFSLEGLGCWVNKGTKLDPPCPWWLSPYQGTSESNKNIISVIPLDKLSMFSTTWKPQGRKRSILGLRCTHKQQSAYFHHYQRLILETPDSLKLKVWLNSLKKQHHFQYMNHNKKVIPDGTKACEVQKV